MVQGVGINLCKAGAEIRSGEELEAFEFGLEDYETKVGFWVRVAGLVFYDLDLVQVSVYRVTD